LYFARRTNSAQERITMRSTTISTGCITLCVILSLCCGAIWFLVERSHRSVAALRAQELTPATHTDEPPTTKPTKAELQRIQEVADEVQRHYGTLAKALETAPYAKASDTKLLAENLKSIRLTGCPTDFQDAVTNHVDALQQLYEILRVVQARGDLLGEGPDREEALATSVKAERTHEAMKKVAASYGVKMKFYEEKGPPKPDTGKGSR
jgi:hypothetical protein